MATRRGLDAETVLDTAERLVDLDGWSDLTMTALARKLGVRPPSLYSHVESVDALLARVQTRALRELGADLQRAAMGRSGPDGVRALAQALRAFAVDHPGRYELAMSEPIDRPAMVEAGGPAGEALGAVIRSFGITMTHELSFTCLSILHGVLILDRAGLYRGAGLDLDAIYTDGVERVVRVIERAARLDP